MPGKKIDSLEKNISSVLQGDTWQDGRFPIQLLKQYYEFYFQNMHYRIPVNNPLPLIVSSL